MIESCYTCKSTRYGSHKMGYLKINGKRELLILACDQCASHAQMDERPRDADGQVVSLPMGFSKPFSYATGESIESSRQYAESLRRLGLAQRKEMYK